MTALQPARFTRWDLGAVVVAALGVASLSLTVESTNQKFVDPSNPVAAHLAGLPLRHTVGWDWRLLWVPAVVALAATVLLAVRGVAPHAMSRIPFSLDLGVPVVAAVALFAEVNRALTFPAPASHLESGAIGVGTWLLLVSGVVTVLCTLQSRRIRGRTLLAPAAPAVVDLAAPSRVEQTLVLDPVQVDPIQVHPMEAGPVTLEGEIVDAGRRWGQRV